MRFKLDLTNQNQRISAYLEDDMPKPSNLPSEWGNVEIHFHTLRSPFQHVILGKGINKHGTFSNKNMEWVNIQHRNGKKADETINVGTHPHFVGANVVNPIIHKPSPAING